jgi:fatty-acyl-CoA synthase
MSKLSVTQSAWEKLSSLRDTARDLRRPSVRELWRAELLGLPKALPILPVLLRARGDADASLVAHVLEHAERDPRGLAVQMGDVELSWRALASRASRVAHLLAARGITRGDVVALIGKNSPDYLALLLGGSLVGATVALVNHHLSGAPLLHAVRVAKAKLALVHRDFTGSFAAPSAAFDTPVATWGDPAFEELLADAPAHAFPRVVTRADDDFVYIYTSGTTGLPKPCRISHARAVVAGTAFGKLLFEFGPGDKLYSALPLYHSSALLIGFGSCVMTHTPLALRESFSASAFWDDVRRYRATAILYIGELCRYLVNSPPTEAERDARVRVALGNGLRADVWPEFVSRFGIRHVREFYAATESPGAIFNLHDRVGSVGRVPFRRLGRLRLARFDVERGELVRGADGLCIECGSGEPGELLMKLEDEAKSALSDFKGYTDGAATEKKIVRDVFQRGDRWFRSGDLMRHDDEDFFYFVDRIGDTYRWKGENVSTAEVAEVLSRAPGVLEATVTGVKVPGAEGQAGLAALVLEAELDAAAFWQAAQELPNYAQPRFLRIRPTLDTTGTFKIQKTALAADGIDPSRVSDPIFVRVEGGYVPFDAERRAALERGELRL